MSLVLAAPAALLVLAGGVPADPPTRLPDAPRIVAIGDVHGDLDATRRALRLAGAIDDEDRWIGGHLVVVQTGDQLDRGDDERAILHLLDRLVGEAREAGGALHVLNGNHEVMNVEADFRYVTEGGWEDFADPGRAAAFRPGGPYARMLSERRTVLMIGPNVFCHAGILPEHVDYGLERLNAELAAWMRGEDAPHGEVHKSLVWTRRWSEDPGAEDCAALADVLERLGAERMIVGHSVQEGGITARCDGAVWCIDVGLAEAYGGPTEVLEIRGSDVQVLAAEAALVPAGP